MRFYNNQFGRHGESWVLHQLRCRGFLVEQMPGNSTYDLLIDGKAKVEVKSATLTYKKGSRASRHQLNLRRHNGSENCADVLFLLCFGQDTSEPDTVFVIPGNLLGTRKKIDISSADPRDYSGRWSRWREDWGVVAVVVDSCALNRENPVNHQEEIPF